MESPNLQHLEEGLPTSMLFATLCKNSGYTVVHSFCTPVNTFSFIIYNYIIVSNSFNKCNNYIISLYLDTQSLADAAAQKVNITYTDCKTPIISIQDAIEASSFFSDQVVDQVFGDPEGRIFMPIIRKK